MDSSTLFPWDAGKFVFQRAQHVSVNQEKVKEVGKWIASKFSKKEYDLSAWKSHPLHPSQANDEAIEWIFFVDTLNFSFWSDTKEPYAVEYNGEQFIGYFSLCAAVKKALEKGIPVTDAKFYSKISAQDFLNIFQSCSPTSIPLPEERIKNLHACGSVLCELYNGRFAEVLRQSEGSALKLLQIVLTRFPCYRDEAIYCGQRLGIYKRAQILIADIWACFSGKGCGSFHDIDRITMFADYRLPQILAYLGVLEYSAELMQILNVGVHLESGSLEEVELRCCSIYAVELVREEISRIVGSCGGDVMLNSILIDYFLWDFRRENSAIVDSVPMHRTRTVFY